MVCLCRGFAVNYIEQYPALAVALLAVLGALQQAVYTWSSRSRASGDWVYHLRAALASNGVFFVCQLFNTGFLLALFLNGSIGLVVAGFFAYVVPAAVASALQVRRMVMNDRGKRRVGGEDLDRIERQLKFIMEESYRSYGSNFAYTDVMGHAFNSDGLHHQLFRDEDSPTGWDVQITEEETP